MTTRTSKIYINDVDVDLFGSTQFADTISGKLYTTVSDDVDAEATTTFEYYINTARPCSSQLGDWADRYTGSISGFRSTAAKCDAKIAVGNIVKPINNGKGRKFVACFIAMFDGENIIFEVHYPCLKGVHYVEDIIIGKNKHGQRETRLMTLLPGASHTITMFPITKSPKRSANAALTIDQEDMVLQQLVDKVKQRSIATQFNVSPQLITKLKKRFKEEGLL